MSRSSRSDRRRRRGFTLAEAVVSLVILIVVMTIALTLLFSMKSFAERQQANMVPRQAARRAIDYLSHFVSSASDINGEFGNPNAIPVRYTFGTQPAPADATAMRQAAYNNLTSGESSLGTVGTDILSLAVPLNPLVIPVSDWPGRATAGATMWLNYRRGCPDNTLNMTLLKQETGAHGSPERSGLLMVTDARGVWTYVEITGYPSTGSDCTVGTDRVVQVTINASGADINPPGGFRDDLVAPVTLAGGIDFVSFRHRVVNNVPALEQKSSGPDGSGTFRYGLFDSSSDNPGTAFVPIVENVEDFQVAYIFRDGTIWNTQSQTLPSGQNGIPLQARAETVSCAGTPTDILCAVGLRVTVVGRSLPLNLGGRNLTDWNLHLRPRGEDRAGATAADTLTTGIFDRHRQTATLMLRNRILGG